MAETNKFQACPRTAGGDKSYQSPELIEEKDYEQYIEFMEGDLTNLSQLGFITKMCGAEVLVRIRRRSGE